MCVTLHTPIIKVVEKVSHFGICFRASPIRMCRSVILWLTVFIFSCHDILMLIVFAIPKNTTPPPPPTPTPTPTLMRISTVIVTKPRVKIFKNYISH